MVWLFALTLFVSALLLFLVQPIMAKQILPWFGGSAAVWTTCLMFFQLVLLFGYAYADWSIRYLRPRAQVLLHVALIALSLLSLPIIAGSNWKPAGDEDPAALGAADLGAFVFVGELGARVAARALDEHGGGGGGGPSPTRPQGGGCGVPVPER